MSNALYRISQSIQNRGVIGTIQSGLCIVEDVCFDLRYGVDTQRRVDLALLTTVGENKGEANPYHPTRGRAFRTVMRHVPFPSGSVFVDFGSGKAKLLLLASRLDFKRVVGVEFSPELCLIAEKNIERWSIAHSHSEILVYCKDAGDYLVRDDENVFFMFNPFGATVMERVLQNISASLQRFPRKVWMIYGNPSKRGLIEDMMEVRELSSCSYGGFDFVVWEVERGVVGRTRAI